MDRNSCDECGGKILHKKALRKLKEGYLAKKEEDIEILRE